MGSSSTFGGIFGRRGTGGNSSGRHSILHNWPLYAEMILCNTGLPWRQGQSLLNLKASVVPFFFSFSSLFHICCRMLQLLVGKHRFVDNCKSFFFLFYRLIKSVVKLLPSFLKKLLIVLFQIQTFYILTWCFVLFGILFEILVPKERRRSIAGPSCAAS